MATGVTIYEVARAAGVSISTVSLALNSPGRVSERTRTKVLKAADSLGFVPKSEAVIRARRSLGRVGVLAPFTSYATFARRLDGVLQAVREAGVDVVVFDQESAATNPAPLLDSLPLTHRLDGLIVMALPLEARTADRLISMQLPTVLVDVTDQRFDSVHTDNFAGGQLVAEHLLAQGHTRFAFVGESQLSKVYVSPSKQRLLGYKATLAEHGISLPPRAIRLTTHSVETAREEALILLGGRPPRTAVFAHDDTLATGVLQAARQLGLSVPEQVAVVGYDDGEVAAALELTTVHQPLEESGLVAARLLMERLGTRESTTKDVELRLDLVRRATT